MTIKHAFVSPKSDEADETLVRPTDWNAEHEHRVALNKLLLGAGPGAEPTEIDPYTHPGTPQCSGCPHPSGRYSHPGSPVCSGCPHPSGRYAHPTTGTCPQTPKAHTLASHSTKAHTELTGVTENQHHTKFTDAEAKAAAVQAGAITNGVTKAPTHDAVYDVKQTADIATTPAEVDSKILTHKNIASAHHTKYTHPTTGTCPQAPKAHTLASHSTKAHSELSDAPADAHHPQSHNAASHSDIASSGANIDDAVAKKHTQGTDTAFTAISQTEPARSIGTQYQNTSGKIRIVTVGALAEGGYRNLMVYIKSTSPADDEMGRQDILENKEGMVTFVVPPGYYYKVDGTATKQEWHEWDLH